MAILKPVTDKNGINSKTYPNILYMYKRQCVYHKESKTLLISTTTTIYMYVPVCREWCCCNSPCTSGGGQRAPQGRPGQPGR